MKPDRKIKPGHLDDVLAGLNLDWDVVGGKRVTRLMSEPAPRTPENRFALGWLRALFLAVCLGLVVRYFAACVHYAMTLLPRGRCP